MEIKSNIAPEYWRGTLRGIDLYINAACNLACTTCFLGEDYFDGSRMAVASAEDIMHYARRAGVEDVAILGGEPTLHPDLDRMVVSARELEFEMVRLVTNGGRRCHRFLSSQAARLLDEIYVSIDGATAATHDRIRGQGSFLQAMSSLQRIRDIKVSLVITTTIGKSNSSDVAGIFQLADESGADRLNIHWLSPTGRAAGTNEAMSGDEWLRLRSQVSHLASPRSSLEIDLQNAFEANAPSGRCAVRERSNLQFMPGGAVHACGLTVSDPRLAAYEWQNGRLMTRTGTTEYSICGAFTEPGCPIRQTGSPGGISPRPVCIYERTHDNPVPTPSVRER